MIKIFKDYGLVILGIAIAILLCVSQLYFIRGLRDGAVSYKEKYEVAISQRDYYKKKVEWENFNFSINSIKRFDEFKFFCGEEKLNNLDQLELAASACFLKTIW